MKVTGKELIRLLSLHYLTVLNQLLEVIMAGRTGRRTERKLYNLL
jgi:hypothetical protein